MSRRYPSARDSRYPAARDSRSSDSNYRHYSDRGSSRRSYSPRSRDHPRDHLSDRTRDHPRDRLSDRTRASSPRRDSYSRRSRSPVDLRPAPVGSCFHCKSTRHWLRDCPDCPPDWAERYGPDFDRIAAMRDRRRSPRRSPRSRDRGPSRDRAQPDPTRRPAASTETMMQSLISKFNDAVQQARHTSTSSTTATTAADRSTDPIHIEDPAADDLPDVSPFDHMEEDVPAAERKRVRVPSPDHVRTLDVQVSPRLLKSPGTPNRNKSPKSKAIQSKAPKGTKSTLKPFSQKVSSRSKEVFAQLQALLTSANLSDPELECLRTDILHDLVPPTTGTAGLRAVQWIAHANAIKPDQPDDFSSVVRCIAEEVCFLA